jgi:hypothetical protein
MRQKISEYYSKNPLVVILICAAFVRLVAAIFSKGYGMHDDQFLIIETANEWLDGTKTDGPTEMHAGAWVFGGLHYCFFRFMHFIGYVDPQGLMLIVRLALASLSLAVVYYAFKITQKLSDTNTAKTAAWIISFLCFLPFYSVRNLVEMACIPFLMYATWIYVKDDEATFKNSLLAGLILGFAFSIRFQTSLFTAGFGLALLVQKQWKNALALTIGWMFIVFLIQGLLDQMLWGEAFAEIGKYFKYNREHEAAFITKPWYQYSFVLAGYLIPPISLFLLFGFFKGYKKWIVFLPTLIFLVVHSYISNKQERFIFPIIPFLVVGGIMGWNEWKSASKFWQNKPKLEKFCWGFFWTINLLLLPILSTSYSKKSRVEPMTYLSTKEVKGIIVEESNRDDYTYPPLFYLGKRCKVYGITSTNPVENMKEVSATLSNEEKPNYVLFYQAENIDERVAKFKSVYGSIELERTEEPSFLDKTIHWINPKNKNEICYIYKIN